MMYRIKRQTVVEKHRAADAKYRQEIQSLFRDFGNILNVSGKKKTKIQILLELGKTITNIENEMQVVCNQLGCGSSFTTIEKSFLYAWKKEKNIWELARHEDKMLRKSLHMNLDKKGIKKNLNKVSNVFCNETDTSDKENPNPSSFIQDCALQSLLNRLREDFNISIGNVSQDASISNQRDENIKARKPFVSNFQNSAQVPKKHLVLEMPPKFVNLSTNAAIAMNSNSSQGLVGGYVEDACAAEQSGTGIPLPLKKRGRKKKTEPTYRKSSRQPNYIRPKKCSCCSPTRELEENKFQMQDEYSAFDDLDVENISEDENSGMKYTINFRSNDATLEDSSQAEDIWKTFEKETVMAVQSIEAQNNSFDSEIPMLKNYSHPLEGMGYVSLNLLNAKF